MAISESSQIRVAIEATRFVGRYDRKPLSLVDVSTDYSVNCLEGHHHATSALEVRCDGWVLPYQYLAALQVCLPRGHTTPALPQGATAGSRVC